MPWSLQNKNALVTDIEHQHDWAIRETRARIAEIENELLEQVTEKARLHLEFDRDHPESGGHASFGTPYQHSVQTVAILKHRLETCTALLADLMPAQEQGGTDKTADCLTGSDRILEMRDDMPKFGKCDNRIYTTQTDVFLDRFEVYLKTFLGPARFERECYRYMVMLIVDEGLQYDLFEAFEYRDKASLTFEECARVFRDMTVQVFN
ncbi:hypothetical protein BGZ72_001508 [Mortierella alpina]|nr:hypothetical protein BGZ72_001508 [Mortierella alpina]